MLGEGTSRVFGAPRLLSIPVRSLTGVSRPLSGRCYRLAILDALYGWARLRLTVRSTASLLGRAGFVSCP